MSWTTRSRAEDDRRRKEDLAAFIQKNTDHSYYSHVKYERSKKDDVERCVSMIRPLGGPFVRVRDMETGEKFNVSFYELKPLNEMRALALFMETDSVPTPQPPIPAPKEPEPAPEPEPAGADPVPEFDDW